MKKFVFYAFGIIMILVNMSLIGCQDGSSATAPAVDKIGGNEAQHESSEQGSGAQKSGNNSGSGTK